MCSRYRMSYSAAPIVVLTDDCFSPYEKKIIEHPSSCYVLGSYCTYFCQWQILKQALGRSGTGYMARVTPCPTPY